MVVDLTIVEHASHTMSTAHGPTSVRLGAPIILKRGPHASGLLYPPPCQSTQAEMNQGKGSWSPEGFVKSGLAMTRGAPRGVC